MEEGSIEEHAVSMWQDEGGAPALRLGKGRLSAGSDCDAMRCADFSACLFLLGQSRHICGGI